MDIATIKEVSRIASETAFTTVMEMIRKMDVRRFVTQREAFNMYGRLNIEVLLKSDAIKPFSVATRDALDKEGNPLVVRKGNIYLSIAEIERAMRLHNLYAGV